MIPGWSCRSTSVGSGWCRTRPRARRVIHALIFTAVYSRHMFVYPTHRQSLDEVIAGFEAVWAFFGGVFRVVI